MEKDLGILKAMGASKKAIALLVLSQTFLVSFVEFLFTLLSLGILISYLNQTYFICLFTLTLSCVGALLALLVGIASLVAFFSSRKAIRQKPINIIEEK